MTTSYNPDYDTPRSPHIQNDADDIHSHEYNHYDEDDNIDETNNIFKDNDNDDMDEEKQQVIRIESDTASPLTDPLADTSTKNNNLRATFTSQSLSTSPDHRIVNNNTMHTSASANTLHNLNSNTSNNKKNNNKNIRKPKYNMSTVERIISITPTCYLKPKCFFVAWNSVITLVFQGWPEPIDTMKRELASSCTVCKEMFGSKFPKITLACVKDGVEMKPKVLGKLRRLCASNPVPKDYVLCLDSFSVVLWENRCQESIIYEKIIPTKKNHKFLGSPRPLLLNMEDQDDAPYLRSANRTSHYKSLIIGASIVHRLIHVPKFITDFQKKLPKEIFDVFHKDSLHVTIRALC
eukprot:234796_1